VMLEYYFPNEAAEPLLWHPVLFAYTLLVSGADLLILAALAYLSGSLRKAIPLMTMLGIGFFAVVLAGPLADLRSPQRAALIFTRPHIAATAANPGISLTAFQSIAWLVALVLSVIFALLTFSYYSHQASLTSSGFRRKIYQAFSLGVTTSERYGSVEKAAKVVAVLNPLGNLSRVVVHHADMEPRLEELGPTPGNILRRHVRRRDRFIHACLLPLEIWWFGA